MRTTKATERERIPVHRSFRTMLLAGQRVDTGIAWAEAYNEGRTVRVGTVAPGTRVLMCRVYEILGGDDDFVEAVCSEGYETTLNPFGHCLVLGPEDRALSRDEYEVLS